MTSSDPTQMSGPSVSSAAGQGQVVDTEAYRSGADRTGATADSLRAEVQRFLGEVSDASVLGQRDTIGRYANPMYSIAIGYVGRCLGELAGSYDDHARALAGSSAAYRCSEDDNAASAAALYAADPTRTDRSGDWTPDGPVQRQPGFEGDRSDRWEPVDRDGFDQAGYDRDGFNRDRYGRDGFDRNGFDRDGFDRNGFDRNGYDRNGYDHDGFDRREVAGEAGSGSGTSAAGLDQGPLTATGADGTRPGTEGASPRGLGPAATSTPGGSGGGGTGFDPRLGRAAAPGAGLGGSPGPAGGPGGPMPMGAGGRRKDDRRGKAADTVEDESLGEETTDDQTSIWDTLRPAVEEDKR